MEVFAIDLPVAVVAERYDCEKLRCHVVKG